MRQATRILCGPLGAAKLIGERLGSPAGRHDAAAERSMIRRGSRGLNERGIAKRLPQAASRRCAVTFGQA